jgi:hypothetical protein
MRARGLSSPDYFLKQNLLPQRKQDLQPGRNNSSFDAVSVDPRQIALQPQASRVVQNLNAGTNRSECQDGSTAEPGLPGGESNLEDIVANPGTLPPLGQDGNPILKRVGAPSVKDVLASYRGSDSAKTTGLLLNVSA